jgi:hypothetical protein
MTPEPLIWSLDIDAHQEIGIFYVSDQFMVLCSPLQVSLKSAEGTKIFGVIWQIKAAALTPNFEEAKRLRDMTSLMRVGATLEEAGAADASGLDRPRPGGGACASRQAAASKATLPTALKTMTFRNGRAEANSD